MIVPQPEPTGPLVMPALDVWRITDDGRLTGIDSCWEADGEVRQAHAEGVAEWLAAIRRAWRASPARSDERWTLTHRWLPDGDTGWLALLQQGISLLGTDWEATRGNRGIAGLTARLPGRLTLHLGSASNLTTLPLEEMGLAEGDPTQLLAGLRRVAEGIGIAGHCPMTLTGLACRLYAGSLRFPVVTPKFAGLLDWEQSAVTPPRVEATPGSYPEGGTQYDLRGAYTAAMTRAELPTNPRGRWTAHYHPGEVGIYRGRFHQPYGLPPLLWDHEMEDWRHDGSGTYCSNEIASLVAAGGSFDVDLGYVYDRHARCLSRFASACWDLRGRVAGNALLEPLAKQLPLRLYGRSLSHTRARIAPLTRELELPYTMISDELAEVEEEVANPWRWPAWGAIILAQNRIAVWEAMCEAVRASGRVVSVYVDSLVVVGAELPVAGTLGALKAIASGPVTVLNAQTVRVGRRVRSGGIPRRLLDPELVDLAIAEPQPVGWVTRASYLEVLRAGILAGTPVVRHGSLRPQVDREAWREAFTAHRTPPPLVEYVPEAGVWVGPDGLEAEPPDPRGRLGGMLPPAERVAADD